MARSEDITLDESLKSKLDVTVNTLNALCHRIVEIERFVVKIL